MSAPQKTNAGLPRRSPRGKRAKGRRASTRPPVAPAPGPKRKPLPGQLDLYGNEVRS